MLRIGVWLCGIAALLFLLVWLTSWASYCTADPLDIDIDGARLMVQGATSFVSAAVLIWVGVLLDRARERNDD